MDRTDAGRAIAEVHDRDTVFTAKLSGESEAVGNRRSGPDDGRCQHGTRRGIGDMRRTSFSLVDAVD